MFIPEILRYRTALRGEIDCDLVDYLVNLATYRVCTVEREREQSVDPILGNHI